VGGFHRVPNNSEIREIIPDLERARDIARDTVRWTATLNFPDFEQPYTFVSLAHPEEYPMNEGRVVSNRGLNIPATEFDQHFEETHVSHSHALHCVSLRDGRSYHVGPMARYALNSPLLPAGIRAEARNAGLGAVCNNPFRSIIIRAVETLYACEEALRIIHAYEQPEKPSVEINARAGMGRAATEAPRGILYHRYEIDDNGSILDADIIPPTSQNQKMIEDDLWKYTPRFLSQSDEKIREEAERAIRNYDPCISCATHFLKLTVDRK
jgi:coenzyme F420-reducing hydrogenase alpha subunit